MPLSEQRFNDLREDYLIHKDNSRQWKADHLDLHQKEMLKRLSSNRNTAIFVAALAINTALTLIGFFR